MFRSFQTHIIGPQSDILNWTIDEWFGIVVFIQLLILYFSLYIVTGIFHRFIIFTSRSVLFKTFIGAYTCICRPIPIIGNYKVQMLSKCGNSFEEQVIPKLRLLQNIWEKLFNSVLFFYLFENRGNTQIFFPSGSEDIGTVNFSTTLTTLIVANHRSIVDYPLINFLLQKSIESNGPSSISITLKDILKKDYSKNPIQPVGLRFIGFGKTFKMIRLDVVKDVFLFDKKNEIEKHDIKRTLDKHGNHALVLFPEGNIFSTESSIIQRKLNENFFPYVPKFYNLLYPKFKTFTELLLGLQPYKNESDNKSGKGKTNGDRPIKLLWYFTESISKYLRYTDKNDPIDSTYSISTIPQQCDDHTPNQNIHLNNLLWDLSIIYYRAKKTKLGHDHNCGKTTIHKGIQLEQITPSLLGMVAHNLKNANDPIFISVNIQKHPLADILHLKPKKMEKWLESHWGSKDRDLNKFQDSVVLM